MGEEYEILSRIGRFQSRDHLTARISVSDMPGDDKGSQDETPRLRRRLDDGEILTRENDATRRCNSGGQDLRRHDPRGRSDARPRQPSEQPSEERSRRGQALLRAHRFQPGGGSRQGFAVSRAETVIESDGWLVRVDGLEHEATVPDLTDIRPR